MESCQTVVPRSEIVAAEWNSENLVHAFGIGYGLFGRNYADVLNRFDRERSRP